MAIEGGIPSIQTIPLLSISSFHSYSLISLAGHENSAAFELRISELRDAWKELRDAIAERKERLGESEKAHQFLHDCGEAEAWMSEQELYMMQVRKEREGIR